MRENPVNIGDYVVITGYNTLIEFLLVTETDKEFVRALDWNFHVGDLHLVDKVDFRRLTVMASKTAHRQYLSYLDQYNRTVRIYELKLEVVVPA
jgi:hypothetical protein